MKDDRSNWIYEDELPEMSDRQYAEWFTRSKVIDGVRMGPPVLSAYAQQELVYLQRSKGWTTIFYITETQSRARAFEELEKTGRIQRDRSLESGYPHMFYRLE